MLIHVCQRWRHIIIFESPRHLDLRLSWSHRTSAKRSLDIWPPFPISLYSKFDRGSMIKKGLKNIRTALKRRDRVSSIKIFNHTNGPALEKLMTMMHEPFPILTECCLVSSNQLVSMPVLPETFLGGSAPLLRSFILNGIPFPTFPSFILSSTQIQRLCLSEIPDSGYISPEIMATCLAALPNLQNLFISFRSRLSRPLQRTAPPLECVVLPALTRLSFEGVLEYFEDLIAGIDTPQLTLLGITFFCMDFIFDIPQLRDFMNRTERANQARVVIDGSMTQITLESQAQFKFELGIKSNRPDRQLSLMIQIFSQQLPLLSHVEHFEIREPFSGLYLRGQEGDPDMNRLQWLELFRLLIFVKSLYVSKMLVYGVAATLKELTGELTIEVLPVLRSLSLEGLQPSGPVQDAIKPFVTARQLTNHPIDIQPWEPQPSTPPSDLTRLTCYY
jgi:hypothetical protein